MRPGLSPRAGGGSRGPHGRASCPQMADASTSSRRDRNGRAARGDTSRPDGDSPRADSLDDRARNTRQLATRSTPHDLDGRRAPLVRLRHRRTPPPARAVTPGPTRRPRAWTPPVSFRAGRGRGPAGADSRARRAVATSGRASAAGGACARRQWRTNRSISLASWLARAALAGRAGRPARDLASQRRGHVQVVQLADVVLERDDLLDEWRRLRLERLARELERVAQPLAGDPQLVEGRKVRLGQRRRRTPTGPRRRPTRSTASGCERAQDGCGSTGSAARPSVRASSSYSVTKVAKRSEPQDLDELEAPCLAHGRATRRRAARGRRAAARSGGRPRRRGSRGGRRGPGRRRGAPRSRAGRPRIAAAPRARSRRRRRARPPASGARRPASCGRPRGRHRR